MASDDRKIQTNPAPGCERFATRLSSSALGPHRDPTLYFPVRDVPRSGL